MRAKYMTMSRYQNASQNHNINIGNKSVEWVEQFKIFGNSLTTETAFIRKLGAN
jgi:hypothetical protein